MPQYAFALTNVYASEQILASAVLESYLRLSVEEVYPNEHTTIRTLRHDTPWLLLQRHALCAPTAAALLAPWDPVYQDNSAYAFTQQYILLSIACSASVVAQCMSAKFVFVDQNGCLPSSGFAAVASLVASASVPVVYWKDEERTVWGFSDDPLAIGCLPGATRALTSSGPPALSLSSHLATLNCRGTGDCACKTFPILIREALSQSPQRDVPLSAGYVASLVQIGNDLNATVLFKGGYGSWRQAIDGDAQEVYATIKRVLARHVPLLGRADQEFLGPVLSAYRERLPSDRPGGGCAPCAAAAPPSDAVVPHSVSSATDTRESVDPDYCCESARECTAGG